MEAKARAETPAVPLVKLRTSFKSRRALPAKDCFSPYKAVPAGGTGESLREARAQLRCSSDKAHWACAPRMLAAGGFDTFNGFRGRKRPVCHKSRNTASSWREMAGCKNQAATNSAELTEDREEAMCVSPCPPEQDGMRAGRDGHAQGVGRRGVLPGGWGSLKGFKQVTDVT